jgi:hypothetical protein
MTAFPHTSAGNIFHVGIATPMGRRHVIAHFDRSSLGTVCPNKRRPSVAA